MPGSDQVPSRLLTVLLAGADPERAGLLKARLRETDDAVTVRVADGRSLLDTVAATAPDVIVVDMTRPDPDRLDELRRVSRHNPRPIVMFVGRDDHGFMEEAISAGVCSYNVVSAAFPDVKPIVMAAIAIFHRYREVEAELYRAQTTLLERDNIDRAKALLMRQRKLDEPKAYRWLQRKAMAESKRIAAVAAELLAAAEQEAGR